LISGSGSVAGATAGAKMQKETPTAATTSITTSACTRTTCTREYRQHDQPLGLVRRPGRPGHHVSLWEQHLARRGGHRARSRRNRRYLPTPDSLSHLEVVPGIVVFPRWTSTSTSAGVRAYSNINMGTWRVRSAFGPFTPAPPRSLTLASPNLPRWCRRATRRARSARAGGGVGWSRSPRRGSRRLPTRLALRIEVVPGRTAVTSPLEISPDRKPGSAFASGISPTTAPRLLGGLRGDLASLLRIFHA